MIGRDTLGVVHISKQMLEPWRNNPAACCCMEPDFGVRVFCFLNDIMAIYNRGSLGFLVWEMNEMQLLGVVAGCVCILRNIPNGCEERLGFLVLF